MIGTILLLAGFIKVSLKEDNVVGIIDKVPITVKEFNMLMQRNVANVYSDYHNKYDATYEKEFWTTSFDGNIPIETLKEMTFEQLKSIKIQQSLFKKYGVVSDISYDGFLAQLEEENKERDKKIKEGQPVYGPVSYGESDYYEYLFYNNVIALKETLDKTILRATQEELKAYYDLVREEQFKTDLVVEAEIVSYPYYDLKTGLVDEEKKQMAQNEMEEYKREIKNGASLKEIAGKSDTEIPYYTVESFGSDQTGIDKAGTKEELSQIVMSLKEGELSAVYDINNSYLLIRCIKRNTGVYESFDTVKNIVEKEYKEKKYQDYIKNLLDHAKIEKKERVLQDVKVG